MEALHDGDVLSSVLFDNGEDVAIFLILFVALFVIDFVSKKNHYVYMRKTIRDRVVSGQFDVESPIATSSTHGAKRTFVAKRVGSMMNSTSADGVEKKRSTDVDWYMAHRAQISFYPPEWVFPVVWTTIYAFCLASFYAFFRHIKTDPGLYMDSGCICIAFWIMLNKKWTVIFFDYRMPGVACIMTIIMIGIVAYLSFVFYKIGLYWGFAFQILHLAWLLFAVALNMRWIVASKNV